MVCLLVQPEMGKGRSPLSESLARGAAGTRKRRTETATGLGGRAKPANGGQVKTGQRGMHSGH